MGLGCEFRPQGGGPRSGPVLPARETIKQLIASIDGGWLAERRALLLQEQPVQGPLVGE